MTVQFAGSGSLAERRRRRLAVNGDAAASDAAEVGEEKFLPDCVPAELCAASPWIPRSLWKLWTLSGLLMAGLISVSYMVFRTPLFRPELAPALNPLFLGEHPRLVSYLEIIFWTLSGQLALLVGWHRAHSRLDFRGRYRIWPWAAATMFFAGFCAATNLHHGLGNVIYQLKLLELSSPKISWFLPAVCLTLPLWLLVDRDLRRSAASIMLFRTAIACLLTGAGVGLLGPSWIQNSHAAIVETVCGLFGPAILMLSLWVQGWYVAYVTPDPPTPTPFKLPRMNFGILSFFGWVFGLFGRPFRRQPKEEAPAPRRRKKAEEAGPAKRKRKTKRVTKPRTKKVVEEELEEEESIEDESEEATEDESSESVEEESYEDEEEYEESPPAKVTAPSAAKPTPPPPSRQPESRPEPSSSASNKWAAASNEDEEYEEEEDVDEDGKMYRVDGPPAEMLKGLSKRQKRAMQKQWRDQQRTQKGR